MKGKENVKTSEGKKETKKKKKDQIHKQMQH